MGSVVDVDDVVVVVWFSLVSAEDSMVKVARSSNLPTFSFFELRDLSVVVTSGVVGLSGMSSVALS